MRRLKEEPIMDEKNEQEFVDQYVGYPARKTARDLHRALHPVGMRTNGPCRVQVEASHLMQLLKPFMVPQGGLDHGK